MVRKEDLRIIKTKAALRSSYFEMLKEMTLEDITVNELCDRAGVRRATFYKHFKDKTDFTLYLIKDLRDMFENTIWSKYPEGVITKEYYLEYAKTILTFLVEQEKAIKKVLESPIKHAFVNLFVQQNYADTKRRLEMSAESGMQLVSSPEVVAGMLVSGTARCVVNWFESEDKCPAEVLLKDISKFIEKVLS